MKSLLVISILVGCGAELGPPQESALVSPNCNCPCSKSGCDAQGFCILDPMPDGTACTMPTHETGGTCLGGDCTLASHSAGTCATPQATGVDQTEPIPSSGCKNLLQSALSKLTNIGGCSKGWGALCTCFNGFGMNAVSVDCRVDIANTTGSQTCTPTTCATQGKNCGTISDGCGGTLTCGSCSAPATCGGGGVANVCGTAGGTDVLTLTATGRAGETVSSTPAGLAVASGTTGSHAFASGQTVTLSVSNTRDAIWSGTCSSGGLKQKTCTFTISTATSETANIQ